MMSRTRRIRVIVRAALLTVFLLPAWVQADAIIRSQAMFAETIAEIYVTEDELVTFVRMNFMTCSNKRVNKNEKTSSLFLSIRCIPVVGLSKRNGI